jgi:hypothetical protein
MQPQVASLFFKCALPLYLVVKDQNSQPVIGWPRFWKRKTVSGRRSRSVTFLVLLPRPARTRIIAPDLCLPSYNLLRRRIAVRSGHTRFLQLTFLAALELRFKLVNGRRGAFARRSRLLVAITVG